MNKMRIRKIGVLSLGKILAAMYFVLSLLIAIPYGLFIIVFALSGASGASSDVAFMVGGGGVVIGLVVMIALPIFYAVIGFIGGIIAALVYNIFAGMVGGIEIEVENVH